MIWNPCRCIFLILPVDKAFISKKKKSCDISVLVEKLLKESFSNDSQQFHEHQQNEQPPPVLNR